MGFQCLNNRQWIELEQIKDSDAQGRKHKLIVGGREKENHFSAAFRLRNTIRKELFHILDQNKHFRNKIRFLVPPKFGSLMFSICLKHHVFCESAECSVPAVSQFLPCRSSQSEDHSLHFHVLPALQSLTSV